MRRLTSEAFRRRTRLYTRLEHLREVGHAFEPGERIPRWPALRYRALVLRFGPAKTEATP